METYKAQDFPDVECARVHQATRLQDGRPVRFERMALRKKNILTPDGEEWYEPDLFDICNVCRSLRWEDFVTAMMTSGTHFSVIYTDRMVPVTIGVDIPCEEWREPIVVGGEVRTVDWVHRRFRNHHFNLSHMLHADGKELDSRLMVWQGIVEKLTGLSFFRDGAKIRFQVFEDRVNSGTTRGVVP